MLKELVRNFWSFRKESKRIELEINNEGIYKYVEKHHGFTTNSAKMLEPKHG
jgi:hypothetical protein